MNATTMPNATWEHEAKVLRRLIRLKEAKHFGVAMIEERNDMGYPVLVEPPDGNWFVGFGYAMRFTLILVALIVAGCFLLPKKAHSAQTTASWYGTTGDTTDPWKHTTTANGEHFDENALTAASWGYKFGTRVKVTNLRNGKSVIVRINDRGPGKKLYRNGRIIDLTRGSFARLAALRDGVIPIKVTLCN